MHHTKVQTPFVCLALAVLFAASPAFADCGATPFACDVDEAIENGLQHLRNLERGEGNFGDPRGTFLGTLSFLEKRQGAGWQGNAQGFTGMAPDDQALVVRTMVHMINYDPAMTNAAAIPDNYVVGGNLMAMSAYLATGGPDEVGAQVTVTQAVANGIEAVTRMQGNVGDNRGGWNYRSPTDSGDLSVTQFAVAGLSAAAGIIEGADAAVPAVAEFLMSSTNADGGGTYRPRQSSISSMSASALWCYRLAQIPAGDPRAQMNLGWLRQNWAYDRFVGPIFNPISTFYYFWAVEKALTVSTDDGLGGAVYTDAFGDRVPADLGYPEEPASQYFDIAYTLLEWQGPNGAWGEGFNNSPPGWTALSSHAFALLTLERSLGGVCLDTDDDGLCGMDDNCPDLPNPDQADEDRDGVGDACDNCPKVVNRGQNDQDEDAIGDACDRYLCVPDGNPEICDGIDNDCDNLIDIRTDGRPIVEATACATGLMGQCAQGTFDCSAAGQIVCRAEVSPNEEVCDLVDNDCDGTIDEGVRNSCGLCGADPIETCDGTDDDCDGEIDEADGLCENDGICVLGECAAPCGEHHECPDGAYCAEGGCVSICAGVTCPVGACDPHTGLCVDPCADLECGADAFCLDGACVDQIDCYEAGCPAQEICRDGQCIEDPCVDIECGHESFCRDGACVFSCADVACAYGEACVDGQCRDITCGGLVCSENQHCVGGACEPSQCNDEACGAGRVCLDGQCADDPCMGIDCPPHQRCTLMLGDAQCVGDWQRPIDDGQGGTPGTPEDEPDEANDDEYDGAGGAGGGDDIVSEEPHGEDEVGGRNGAEDAPQSDVPPPEERERALPKGCACDTTDASPSPMTALLLLGLGYMRRRRRNRL